MEEELEFMQKNVKKFPDNFDVTFIRERIREVFVKDVYESICKSVGADTFAEIKIGSDVTDEIVQDTIVDLEERGFVCRTLKSERITSDNFKEVLYDDGVFFVHFTDE